MDGIVKHVAAAVVLLLALSACGDDKEAHANRTCEIVKDRRLDLQARGDALRLLLEMRPVTGVQVDCVRSILLSDDDPVLRAWAGGAALEWESEARPLLGAFLSNLRDPNVAVRTSAAAGLVWIDSREDHVLGGLRDLIKSESNDSVLATALGALGMLGDWEARHTLAGHLHHEIADVRAAAADGLGSLGKADTYIIGELASVSRDPSPEVRESVIMALTGLEPVGTQTRQVFIHAAEDETADVRFWAAYGLGNLTPSERPGRVVRTLIKLLDGESDANVQRAAAGALATYGAHAKDAIGALERARERGVQNSTNSLGIIREALAKQDGE